MADKAQPQTPDALSEIRAELSEIKKLLTERNARPGDLVDAGYVARVTGLAERTVLDGKAGTKAIPRVSLGARMVRFQKGAVDRFVAELARKAEKNTTQARVSLRLLKRKPRVA